MQDITRSSLIQNETETLGLTGGGVPPTKLKDDIQPVFEIFPKATKLVRSGTSATASVLTIYSTPTKGDFYLTYLHFSSTKDVASDSIHHYIRFYTEGVVRDIYNIFQISTAGDWQNDITFPYPIKIDKNTSITSNTAFTAGSQSRYLTIGGFILE